MNHDYALSCTRRKNSFSISFGSSRNYLYDAVTQKYSGWELSQFQWHGMGTSILPTPSIDCIMGKVLEIFMSFGKLAADVKNQRHLIPWRKKFVQYHQRYGVLTQAGNLDFRGISWQVKALCESRRLKEAMDLLHAMSQLGIRAGFYVYASLLQGCINMKALAQGKAVHLHMIDSGYDPDTYLLTKLVIMYASCGDMEDACRVFDKMSERNVVTWSSMIAGYAEYGDAEKAFSLFIQMQQGSIQKDSFAFSSVLKDCGLERGKQIHACIFRSGFESDIVVKSALASMYAKGCSIKDSRQVFDEMPERDIVAWNGMVAAYSHCGKVEDAYKIFDKMPCRNTASWNAMIAGYAQHGYCDKALSLLGQMQQAGMNPDLMTFVSICSACADLAALERGKQIHASAVRSGFESYITLGNALIDMYAKCGSMDDAFQVFDKMNQRNIISWTAVIMGYGKHGYSWEALDLFEKMQCAGMNPNHITFLGVLSACSHAGLVDEGWHHFDCISRKFEMKPRMEHYACMVDLLGRSGRLNEAYDLINKMPFEADAEVWGALLGACRVHLNVDLGRCSAERLFQLKPHDSGAYVILSNIYAASGKWDDVASVRKLMLDRGLKKEPGCSWIECNKKVHVFHARYALNLQTQDSYSVLQQLDE